MAQVIIDDTNLKNIADAIRSKGGTTNTLKPSQMAQAIITLPSGGGVPDTIELTGDMSYCFADNRFPFILDNYGDIVNTDNITNSTKMFSNCSSLTAVPFTIDFNAQTSVSVETAYMFENCNELLEIPDFTVSSGGDLGYLRNAEGMFKGCYNLQNIPITVGVNANSLYYGNCNQMFYNCHCIREINNLWLMALNITRGAKQLFQGCWMLNEINDLGAPQYSRDTATTNLFLSAFDACVRLKELTFHTYCCNQWANQTIDLTHVGYAMEDFYYDTMSSYEIGSLNKVYSDTTYQTYKNDNNYYTEYVKYSRYNHDSAVNTINSLPDTSAFLATNGGTNTIKFRGSAGSATDGGAINTLTEEEVAVATAKGWTIAYA